MRDAVIDRRRRLFVYPLRRATNSREVPPDVRAPAGWLRCFAALVGIGLSFGLAGCGVVASSNSSTPSHAPFAPVGQDSGTGDGAGNGESGVGTGDTDRNAGVDSKEIDSSVSTSTHRTDDKFVEKSWSQIRSDVQINNLLERSERFKGKPLTLRPIDGADVDPMFVGKHDTCDPQIIGRFLELGFEVVAEPRFAGPQVYACNFGIPGLVGLPHSVNHVLAPASFRDRATKDFGDDLYAIEDGTWIFTCVAVQQTDPDTVHYFTYSNFKDDDVEYHCDTVRKLRQIFNNVYGGKLQ